jgi:hypothetical protein
MLVKKLCCAAVLLLAFVANATDEFVLSYWCGPPELVKDLNKAYREVAECGFNYAMVPCSGATVKGNQAILDACKKYKIKYLAGDSRLMATGPENPAFTTNLNAVIAEYARHPALGGYYLSDEPSPTLFPQLGAVNQYLLAHDPKHLPFINLYPNYVPEWAIGGSYEQYVDKFLDTVKPRLLSYDHYALLGDGSLRPIFFQNLEIIRRQALKHDVPFALIFQVTPFAGVRDPSEAELRWQANTALAYGAKALLYFTYWTPTGDAAFKSSVAIIDPQGNRSRHFDQVKRVNAAIKAWAPTLMKLKSTGVYHTGELPLATTALPANAIATVSSGAFVIGTFRHEDGSEWLMIVNRDLRQPAKTKLHFQPAVKRLRELNAKNGKLSSMKLRDHELSIELPPGGAKLFKLGR